MKPKSTSQSLRGKILKESSKAEFLVLAHMMAEALWEDIEQRDQPSYGRTHYPGSVVDGEIEFTLTVGLADDCGED